MKSSILISAAALLLCGCTPQMFGAMIGHKPGDTINVAGSSPAYISFVYTHSYPEELPIVYQRADYWCRHYQKKAVLTQNVAINIDRSTAAFSCVQ